MITLQIPYRLPMADQSSRIAQRSPFGTGAERRTPFPPTDIGTTASDHRIRRLHGNNLSRLASCVRSRCRMTLICAIPHMCAKRRSHSSPQQLSTILSRRQARAWDRSPQWWKPLRLARGTARGPGIADIFWPDLRALRPEPCAFSHHLHVRTSIPEPWATPLDMQRGSIRSEHGFMHHFGKRRMREDGVRQFLVGQFA